MNERLSNVLHLPTTTNILHVISQAMLAFMLAKPANLIIFHPICCTLFDKTMIQRAGIGSQFKIISCRSEEFVLS